ncbi:intein-containing Rv2578c family radical SAM protein [Dactylosporangium sp. CS-047395]|uniref:intein-containing Rv2578c family radical SAM protein n=1 Tax=Dactylosporangium sp. CS-047395 TaxID=3239936 RepID=UPI003D904AD5
MRWDNLKATGGPGTGDPGRPRALPLALPGAVARTFDTPEFRGITFYEVQAKSLINKVPGASRVPFQWTINPYRGCSHACVYCLTGDTAILMADGTTRPLADLRVGDEIVGTVRDGRLRRYTTTRVLAHWQTVKPAHRITLADGTALVASGEHRFLTDRGWKHVTGARHGRSRRPHLTTANRLAGFGALPPAPPTDAPAYRRGYLCGFVNGDGHATQVPSAVLDRVHEYAAACGGLHALTNDSREFAGASVRDASALLDWPEKPDRAWGLGFVAGLYDATGSMAGDLPRFDVVDKVVVDWLVECLERAGFATATDDPFDGFRPDRGPARGDGNAAGLRGDGHAASPRTGHGTARGEDSAAGLLGEGHAAGLRGDGHAPGLRTDYDSARGDGNAAGLLGEGHAAGLRADRGSARGDGHAAGLRTDRGEGGAGGVRVLGGPRERVRFGLAFGPARGIGVPIGELVRGDESLRVVGVEPLGVEAPMFDITTGTGDFIANGVVSHNCFARHTHTYLDLDAGRDFDSQIVVKVNAGEVLRRELAARSWSGAHIAMGTNVDVYQRAEGRYKLMREILAALRDRANPFSILTKGTLITRDLDLLKEAASVTSVSLSMSVGFVDEHYWRAVEPGTPSPRRRLDAIRRLSDAGFAVGVLMAPILPGLTDTPESIDATVAALSAAGAASIVPLALHLRPGAREWYREWLLREHPELGPRYRELYGDGSYAPQSYQREIAARVRLAARKHGMNAGDFGSNRNVDDPRPVNDPPRPMNSPPSEGEGRPRAGERRPRAVKALPEQENEQLTLL